ncbi:MAG: hypothetical protein ACFE9X_17240 [Promethearchaeota archaeon]
MDNIIILECRNLLYTTSWKIFDFLEANKERKEPIYSKDIQKAFHIKKRTASQYLTVLEQLGLIKRERQGIFKSISIT